jgi:hypothetical protein
MVFIKVLSSLLSVSLGSPLRVTGRVLLEQKVVLLSGEQDERLVGRGILYASIAGRGVAPSEQVSVAATTADQACSRPNGLFS